MEMNRLSCSEQTRTITIRLLELYHLSLSFFVTTQFKMFTAFQCDLFTELALSTFQTQYNLLRRLRLLVMDRSRLSTITRLFAFVTSVSLCKRSFLCGLVLGDLMECMLPTLLTIAQSFTGFRNVNHFEVSVCAFTLCD